MCGNLWPMAKGLELDNKRGAADSARARLAKNVRLLLAREGWNQLDLARAAGLSQGMISQLLAGERGVRLSTLDRVAGALRVDVGDLFAPIPQRSSNDVGGLDATVRSMISRMSRVTDLGEGAAVRASTGRKILVDPEELHEIGLAIGRAIVEATGNLQTRDNLRVTTHPDDVGGPARAGRVGGGPRTD